MRNQPSAVNEAALAAGIVVIAEMDRGPARSDFADLAVGHVVAVAVENAQFHVADHAADGAVDLLRIVGEAGIGVEAGLQHAVELDQMPLGARLILADRLDRGRRAAGDHHAQRGEVETVELRLGQHGTIAAGAVGI